MCLVRGSCYIRIKDYMGRKAWEMIFLFHGFGMFLNGNLCYSTSWNGIHPMITGTTKAPR